jgi:ligand-binding sensor domain-containing protein
MKQSFCIQKNLLLVYFLCLSVTLFSQSKPFNLQKTEKHLSIVDGLANRHINSCFIDKNKQIWFLTDNKIGLFQFGKINNYLLSETFSNRGFNSAYEDANGNFWISENFEWYYPFNVQRCVIFNPITHKTTSVENYIHQRIAIHSIVSDAKQQIFIGTKDGQIYRFDAKKKTLQLMATFAKVPVKLMYASKRGLFACLEKNARSDNALIQLNYDGQTISQTDLKGAFVRSIIEVENQFFYITLNTNTISMNEIGGNFKKSFPTSINTYLSNIAYSAYNQMLIINDGKSINFYDKNYILKLQEKYNFETHDIAQDNNGNVILSTNNGVFIIQLSTKKIHTFLKNDEAEKFNDNFSCRKILKIDNNQIVVNTNKKRQLINLKTGVIKPLHDFKNENEENPHFVLSSIKDPNGDLLFGEDALVRTNISTMKDDTLCSWNNIKIWAIMAFKDGYLLGLERKGIVFYDKKTKKVSSFSKINSAFENAIVYDFFVDKNGIFIASEAGFYQLSNNSTILKKIAFPAKKDVQMTCFSIQKNKNKPQQLLLATLNGIWIYDLQKHRILPFLQEKKYERKNICQLIIPKMVFGQVPKKGFGILMIMVI